MTSFLMNGPNLSARRDGGVKTPAALFGKPR
jgi:hypothetical protein